jgi:hypothetical protein
MPDMTIHQRMIAVMQEVGFIGKDRKAPAAAGGYNFRGIDDFYERLQPALIKCGVFVLPEVLDIIRERRDGKDGKSTYVTVLKTAYHFYGENGDHVTAVVAGEGSDNLDKACNKGMSSAFKYMASQAWCIPTEDPELDTETNEPEPPPKPAPKKEPPAKPAPKDESLEWWTTLKDTLTMLCEKENAMAVCESILLLDKQSSQLPEDKPPVPFTLMALLGKRGVKMEKSGPVGITEPIGKDVLSLIARYSSVEDAT